MDRENYQGTILYKKIEDNQYLYIIQSMLNALNLQNVFKVQQSNSVILDVVLMLKEEKDGGKDGEDGEGGSDDGSGSDS